MDHLTEQEIQKRLIEYLKCSTVNHTDEIMKCSSLKQSFVYCIYNKISSQKYGVLLEKFIRVRFGYIKNNPQDCSGDCSKNGKNSEIKVSFGGKKHNKFNYVQLRPSHDCDTYILVAYHLYEGNINSNGELYIFRVPLIEIKKLIVSYGGYAHGTIKTLGTITFESLNEQSNTKEYALRPTVDDKCWNSLLQFRISETEL